MKVRPASIMFMTHLPGFRSHRANPVLVVWESGGFILPRLNIGPTKSHRLKNRNPVPRLDSRPASPMADLIEHSPGGPAAPHWVRAALLHLRVLGTEILLVGCLPAHCEARGAQLTQIQRSML